MDWNKKNVLVMGLGLLGGGVGTAMFFAQRGAKTTVTDLRNEETLRPSIEKLREFPITYVLGEHREKDFVNTDLVVKNPGVSDLSPYLVAARKAGVPVETEASIFCQILLGAERRDENLSIRRSSHRAKADNNRPFVIGVTGTKGKTTTSHFIVEGLRACGAKTHLTGIPGTSFLATLGEIGADRHAVVVVEFSSWDLESIARHKVSPPIAVVTNLFPDHLNRHETMEAYLEAKAAVFGFQEHEDVVITPETETRIIARAKRANGRLRVISQHESDAFPALAVLGPHVRMNAALAFAAVEEALAHRAWPQTDKRFSAKRAREAITQFPGLPGRLEFVAECGGRRFVNDTAATNPGAARAALAAFNQPLVLIAGGEDKGLSYDDLADAIVSRVKHLVLFSGSASEKLLYALRNRGFVAITSEAGHMDDAVRKAWKASVAGDAILLSPAAASFNLFKNEFDRGEQFIEACKNLCQER